MRRVTQTAALLVTFALVSPSGLGMLAMPSARADEPLVFESNNVWAWGSNSFTLGDGTTGESLTPVKTLNFTDVVAVSAGSSQSLALRADGTVWAWGNNSFGKLGDGTTQHRLTPVRTAGLTDVVAVSAGQQHSLALDANGTVWAWGKNDGNLGDGTTQGRHTPVRVHGGQTGKDFLTDIVSISAGNFNSLALRADGSVWAWGSNSRGALGDGTTTSPLTPVKTANLTDVVAVSAGFASFSAALRADGTVWAWGRNDGGLVGDNTRTDRHTPVQTHGLTDVVAISCRSHSLAVRGDGTVWGWGTNGGRLGDGTTTSPLTPVKTANLTDVVAVAAGAGHSLALLADGTVWAWGFNGNGQLGDGTRERRLTPVQTADLTHVVAVSASSQSHSLAIVRCPYGQRDDADEFTANVQLVDGEFAGEFTGCGTLGEAAAELARSLENKAPYLTNGKGFDYGAEVGSRWVEPGTIINGSYSYFDTKTEALNPNGKGVDCSGLVMWSYNRAYDSEGILLNPDKLLSFDPQDHPVWYSGASGQFLHNSDPIDAEERRVGDLLFLKNNEPPDGRSDLAAHHVAMYIGDVDGVPSVVHARRPGTLVQMTAVSKLLDDFSPPKWKFLGYQRPRNPDIEFQCQVYSPVSLRVTDPDGHSIDSETMIVTDSEVLREVPGHLYYAVWDLDRHGETDDTVFAPVLKDGRYIIEVAPKPTAGPDATYSLVVTMGDLEIVLAEDVPVSEIPKTGYGLFVSEEGVEEFVPALQGVTFEGIAEDIDSALSLGLISNRGVANSLKKKLEAAEAAVERDRLGAAIRILDAFILEVKAQNGKHIAPEAADVFLEAAEILADELFEELLDDL